MDANDVYGARMEIDGEDRPLWRHLEAMMRRIDALERANEQNEQWNAERRELLDTGEQD